MRKTVKIFVIIIADLSLIACSADIEKNPFAGENSFEDITIKNFPSVQEISQMSDEERIELKYFAKTLPLDECEDYFFDLTESFLESESNVKLDSLEITEDALSLNPNENSKPLRNLYIEVNLVFNDIFDTDLQKNTAQNIIAKLTDNSYIALNTKILNVNSISENGTKTGIMGHSGTDAVEKLTINQPDDEYDFQTVLFDYTAEKDGFYLTKFGNIQENREIFIEYYIDEYFSNNSYSDEESKTELENISKDIKNTILSNEDCTAYISCHNINKLTVSFYSSYFKDLYLTFGYDV